MADTTKGPTHPFTIKLEEGMDESVDNSNLCLIKKIMVPKLLNKQAVSRIILGTWKTSAEVYGLPMDKMTRRNRHIIGNRLENSWD
ncbi:unnamed protein product [Camellia sinensis]